MKYFAGVGSRRTPKDICELMEDISRRLASMGYILRSGHAKGADQAFEKGADKAEIYLPWRKFEKDVPFHGEVSLHTGSGPAAIAIAERYHPAWSRLSPGAKKLIARDTYQVLGENLNTPSEFVICWTPNGREVGGTAQAIRIAKAYEVPVYNLAIKEEQNKIVNLITK